MDLSFSFRVSKEASLRRGGTGRSRPLETPLQVSTFNGSKTNLDSFRHQTNPPRKRREHVRQPAETVCSEHVDLVLVWFDV